MALARTIAPTAESILMAEFKPITFILGLLLLSLTHCPACAQYAGAKPPPNDLKPGFDAVNIDDAKRVLTFLATKCEGRGTGQRGFETAARFVANEFRRIGRRWVSSQETIARWSADYCLHRRTRRSWNRTAGHSPSPMTVLSGESWHGYRLSVAEKSRTASSPTKNWSGSCPHCSDRWKARPWTRRCSTNWWPRFGGSTARSAKHTLPHR